MYQPSGRNQPLSVRYCPQVVTLLGWVMAGMASASNAIAGWEVDALVRRQVGSAHAAAAASLASLGKVRGGCRDGNGV